MLVALCLGHTMSSKGVGRLLSYLPAVNAVGMLLVDGLIRLTYASSDAVHHRDSSSMCLDRHGRLLVLEHTTGTPMQCRVVVNAAVRHGICAKDICACAGSYRSDD